MSEADAVELYRKHRPSKMTEVIGQKEASDQLKDMATRGAIPHCILFTGPSGVGKTTVARILRVKLGCSDEDYQEMNASDARGIDEIREIRSKLGYAPLVGKCRVILIDECHGLTADAQEALLKLLEDTPKHIYFFLCTTVPSKLKKTIITRCTEIKFKEIDKRELLTLVTETAKKEGKTLDEDVGKKLAEASEGSARKALVLLHAILGMPDKEMQLQAIQKGDVKTVGFEIAKMLMDKNTSWKAMAEKLLNVDEEPESIRRVVLGYAMSALLKGWGDQGRAAHILEEFRSPLYDVLKPGLVSSCYIILRGG